MDKNPIRYFQYSDEGCKWIGKLVGNYFNEQAIHRVPYMDLIHFYRQNGALSSPTDGDILNEYNVWVEYMYDDSDGMSGDRLYKIYRAAADHCVQDFCQHIDFSGNPDLAGIGVLVAFAFQLGIAAIFSIFGLYYYLIRKNEKGDQNEDQKIKWKVFRDAFHTFFTTSIYFNIALAVAVVVTIAIDDKTQYTAVVANLNLLMSLSSTQALWPLYVLYIEGRPQEIKDTLTPGSVFRSQLLKACLGLLCATLLGTCAATAINVNWGTNFELVCFHAMPGRYVASSLLYAPIGITALGLIIAALRQWYPRSWPLEGILCRGTSSESKLLRWFYIGMLLLGLSMMWVAFVVLWMLRTGMAAFTNESYEENDWGFGQIVAVVAWLPTVVAIVWEIVESVQEGGWKRLIDWLDYE
ncbi:hypothetical protein CMUS01_14963 [Colletotrichum musicola]|uniref:Uncharacterized protein n=1 Tax=Colletotrichum musicola TaxID=2175873 RepID=A0A8H6J070_9PEZI|nr:hypothetical protein CMUS01_14963 [Colletotrichum musicola]